MSKVYSFEDSQQVIKDAWNKAIRHLEDTLGDQYKCWETDDARCKFYDKVNQDIEFKMTCPCCGNVDIEGNFSPSLFEPNVMICYYCYTEESLK